MKKLLTIVLFFFVSYGFACSCIKEKISLRKQIQKAYKQSDIIFTGKVTSIQPQEHSSLLKVTFKVDKPIKGNRAKTILEIFTERESATCGFTFTVGKNYIVYGYEQTKMRQKNSFEMKTVPPFLSTDICTRTQEITSVKKCELRKLNKLAKKENE